MESTSVQVTLNPLEPIALAELTNLYLIGINNVIRIFSIIVGALMLGNLYLVFFFTLKIFEII